MPRQEFWSDHTKVLGLTAVMMALVLLATVLSTFVLYHTALNEERAWLEHTAATRANLISAMYSHEIKVSEQGFSSHESPSAAVLEQLRSGLSGAIGFGATGEFTLGHRQQENIEFLLPLRHPPSGLKPPLPWHGRLAAPMRQALQGNTGEMVGLDYRGVQVLAAYRPVTRLGWGLVAKVDMKEVQAPFVKAGLRVGALGCGLALLGGLFIGRTGNRFVGRIRESERRLQTLMNNLPGMAYRCANDPDWTMEMVSNGCRELTGLPPEDLVANHGKSFGSLIHPQDQARVWDGVQTAIAGRKPFTLEYRIVAADGQVKQVWEQGRAVPGEDGKATWIEGFVMDVTASREATEALAESEIKFRTLYESMQEGVALHALVTAGDGHPINYRILDVNPAFERILGITREQAVGKLASDIYPAGEVPFLETYAEVALSGTPASFESYYEPFGKHFQINASAPIRGQFATVFEDISDRKRTEAELHASSRRFELLAWTAAKLLQAENPQKIIENLCRQVMEVLDCHAFFNFLADDVAGRLHLNACAGIPEEEVRRLEWLEYGVAVCGCVARDGCRIVAENIKTTEDVRTDLVKSFGIRAYACHPLLGQGGKLIGTLSFGTRSRDTFSESDLALMQAVSAQVTMAMIRLQNQRSLQESEERLRRAVINAPFPVMIHAEDGEVLLLSRAWTEIAGYPPEEIPTTQDWARAAYGALEEPVRELIDQLYAIEERVHDGEFQITTKDGRVRTWDFSSAPLGRSTDGRRTLISMAIDVTDRKAAEAALAASEARYRTYFEAGLIGMAITSPDNYWVEVNDRLCEILGYAQEELQGMTWTELTHPDDLKAELAQFAVLLAGEADQYTIEKRFLRRDGQVIHAFIAVSCIRHPDGTPDYFVKVVQDITERKEAQQQLADTIADLKRSNRELEQFAYVASHDLQEPLRMVASYVQLLQRRYQDRLDADAAEFIGFAVEGATRMQALINDLLAFSRIGRQNDPVAEVDCEQVLQDTLNVLAPKLRETGGIVTHDPLPRIQGTRSQIFQVFQNLVGNGLKFHGEQPPQIHVGARQDGQEWEFTVRDNGIGIEPRFFNRLFIIFQRLHTKKDYPGTGIGLALVKKIVERHGGRIWLESQPGEGTTFYFTFKGTE